ncbi:putative endonuclease 4 [Candidatus Mycoplasma haematohominis]|uniref:Probable endonuclease 4 n=1 Tax=Candidatus Mycoplasma haematohominis TaxID=1494318 RepID=A0A478FSI9_9MOLU|nr:putative endonuclease 4 [Candidatus Mycoplasma haemohominis]
MFLGSHISLNKKNRYLVGVVEESIYNGATTFMIFTGAPHNKKREPISSLFLEEAKELGLKHGIDFKNCVVHAPYIINLANPKPENQDFNIDQMVSEVKRTNEMGIPFIVLHPGYHVEQTWEEGMKRLINNLKIVLKRIEDTNVTICLETMPGKKNQLGSTFEELSEIIKGCDNHKQLGVCLDTVHMHDAGYDVINRDNLFNKIDSIIGLNRIKVLHLGDSTSERGGRKDKHANFEYGKIGFKPLLEWAYDPFFANMPIIIETPFWISKENKKKTMSPYKHEIRLIKQKKWEPIPEELNYRPR